MHGFEMRRVLRWGVCAGLGCLIQSVPVPSAAQTPGRLHPRWEIPGFDFSRDGVWRKRSRQVAARRAAMLARRQFAALNAPLAARVAEPSGPAVMGTLEVPVILFKYADSPVPAFDTAAYNAVLFGTTPPLGRPYTYRSFYQQLSNGLLDIQGQTYGYAALDSNEETYAGKPPCSGSPFGNSNCNGLFDGGQVAPDPVTRMQSGLTRALAQLDASIDWTQYDRDADGYVDLVVFIQPALDGACGGASNNHLWSHRFFLGAYVPEFQTHSPGPGGVGFEKVRDYILQSGLGGSSACDTMSIMPIGTVAHETGHGFGLPDLYDTGLYTSSEGIGEWGLMGEGNYATALSPARMEAWSLNELGWVTIVPLTAAGTYSFGAAPLSDTTFYIRAQGANPRGEYYLLENRQARQSDSALIRKHGGGGLLVWHVDSTQIAQHGFNGDNTVNAGPIHGLALVQADNRGDLDAGRNRGDGGDPYPGTTSNVTLSLVHAPFPLKNVDGSFAGFSLDSIWQVAPDSMMAFRVSFGAPTPAAQAVIDQLLIGTGLAPTDQTYLDLSGNRNAQYDVGDFLAWVNAGNVP
ncbi:MAG TPA: M6 family metalloprotease domain-containing protein [Gemmatimonadales bacterium]|nr:M6 family metalloprotease domain-containing protein [Gemmatimonadales bacterium]